jgi:Tol biopolymer transport system component
LRIVELAGEGVPASRLLFKNDEIDSVHPWDWSPDGKWIAVEINRVDKTAQIGIISVADGTLRILKSVDWRGSTMLVFSPDGKYLAYDLPAGDDVQQRDVFVLAVDGSREIPAIIGPSQDVVIGWTNDGSRLLFASDRGGSVGLWSVRFADGKIEGGLELLRRDLGELSRFGFTESGKLYAKAGTPYPGRQTDVHLASIDFTTGKLLSAPSLAAQTFVGDNLAPAWSPDGKYLAYASRRRSIGPHHFVLAIRSVETGQIREVSPSPAMDQVDELVWAPDGRSLLVTRRDVKGR